MSTFAGPSIVIPSSGLILDVDAANTKSYPGNGTIWYDLSGNNNNGTLQNNPTFNADKTFSFDGLTQYVLFGTYNSMTAVDNKAVTIDIWTNFNFANSPGALTSRGFLGFYTSNSDNLSIKATSTVFGDAVDSTGARVITQMSSYVQSDFYDKWCNFTLTYGNRITSMYYNGIFQVSNPSANDVTFQDNVFDIGYGDGYYRFYGKMSAVKIYNRALSSDEVVQNFNAYRGRYGL